MAFTFNADITPKAAARLLISNDISIEGYWHTKQAETLLDELLRLKVEEILKIIDSLDAETKIDSATLPQFGSLEMLIRVPEVMISTGLDGLSYTQLGFYLKDDVNAKQSANAKYGETHGKGACQLGFANCQSSKIHFGALTNAFYDIKDPNTKLHLARILCFRIPIIQTLLINAKYSSYNGYLPMSHLEKSTQKRRAICVRMILKELKQLDSDALSRRINNIVWAMEEGDDTDA